MKSSPAIMGTLLLFSILIVAYTFERWWVFHREARLGRKFWDELSGLVRAGNLGEAVALCGRTGGVFARIFAEGIQGAQVSRNDAEDAMMIQKEEGQELLRRRLGIFGTLSFVSPLLGLLGTVLGILRAFNDLALAGSGGPTIVAAGISQALTTTVAGILVAVLASLCYNYFTFRLRGILVEMNTFSQRLLVMMGEGRRG
jgi:biopolymer transport protein ExbB